MTDIAKTWDGQVGDLVLAGASFADDGDLDAALINSLFTDRRAEPDDPLPADVESRRGWWGDTLAIADGNDRIGSRLWLISREKQTAETLNRAREYAREALAWLVEDGVAEAVEVDVEWVRMGVLGIEVRIIRPTGEQIDRRFDHAWDQIG